MNIVQSIELFTLVYSVLVLVIKVGTMFALWGMVIAGNKVLYAVRDYIYNCIDKS